MSRSVEETSHLAGSAGGWWTKPTFQEPVAGIDEDGTWSADITTGGNDETATKICVFLVPGNYPPPSAEGEAVLPGALCENAVDFRRNLQTSKGTSGYLVHTWVEDWKFLISGATPRLSSTLG